MRRITLLYVVLVAAVIYVPLPASAISLFGESARLVKIMDPTITLSVFMLDPRTGETEIFIDPAKQKCGEDGIRIAQNRDPVEQGLIVVVKATGGLGNKSLALAPIWRLDMRDMALSRDMAKNELVVPPEPGDSVTDWIRFVARSRPARAGGFRPFATSKPPFYAVYDTRNGAEGDCVSIELFVRQRKGYGAVALVSFYVSNAHDVDTGERLDLDDKPVSPPWPDGLWGDGRRDKGCEREDAASQNQPPPDRHHASRQPGIQIMDQPGLVPDVDVSRYQCAGTLQDLAAGVGYGGHLLQYVPAFDSAGCTQTCDGKKITHPAVIFFVNRAGELLDCSSAQLLKRGAGYANFSPTKLNRDLRDSGRYFLFIANAQPGDAFAPKFRGKPYWGVPIREGCGAWYPVIVE